MAWIQIVDDDRSIKDQETVTEFLAECGISYERWELEDRVSADADDQTILEAYDPEIQRLKAEGGYTTADVVCITPQTPNLDALLEKFSKEHTHSEDEIRFAIKGSGVFYINPDNGPVFAIYMEAGDMIGVPKGTQHWFHMCDDHNIRCIRLFEDPSGWVANYVDEGLHAGFQPVCWGPNYIPPSTVDVKNIVQP